MKACPWCAESIQDAAVVCRFCHQRVDAAPAPPPAPGTPFEKLGEDAGMRMLLPVGRSWLAIAAGYLGLFSVLIIFAPICLIVSIAAAVHLKQNPHLHGWGRTIFGLVMGVLCSVGFVVMMIAIARG